MVRKNAYSLFDIIKTSRILDGERIFATLEREMLSETPRLFVNFQKNYPDNRSARRKRDKSPGRVVDPEDALARGRQCRTVNNYLIRPFILSGRGPFS